MSTYSNSKFGQSVEQVHILSIGTVAWANNPSIIALTGHSVNLYTHNRFWGLITGWGRRKLVAYVLRLQSEASANMAKLLLGDKYLRLDPEIEDWALDDLEHLDNLKAMAARDFTYWSGAIVKNLKRRK